MVDSGRELWERERPAGVPADSVRFTPHDFFQVNPVKDADVYWLRYILSVMFPVYPSRPLLAF